MIRKLYYLHAGGTDPYENLALERYLLRRLPEGACILYLWQNRNTVVIGRNQNAFRECRTALLEQEGGLLARRPSGGGAVFHDLGNLNFTFVVGKEDYSVARQSDVIVRALADFGIAAERSGRNDLLAGGLKFSGNAFLETDAKAVHHGTLLVDVDMEKLSRYLRPSAQKLRAKGVSSVRSRVVNLHTLAPRLTVEALRARLVSAFSEVYGGAAELYVPQEPEVLAQLRSDFADPEWLYGRRRPFDLSLEDRFSWGEVTLEFSVSQGVVSDLCVYTDALDETLSARVEAALRGCRFRGASLCAALSCLPSPVREDLCRLLAEL